MAADDIAAARQEQLITLNRRATNGVLSSWGRVDVAALDESWAAIAPAVVQRVQAAQFAAAVGSDRFTARLSSAYGFDQEVSALEPLAFVGADGSGRTVDGLLHGAVTTTKEAIGAGLGRRQAFEAGAAYLAAMVKTVVADLARSADMSAAVGKGFTRYVRVVEPGACSRCVMLSGAQQFKPFKRHPACKCTVQAVPESDVAEKYSADAVFDRMSEAEQDRAFTKAGAEAIRQGADMNQVVSARRGATGIGYSHRLPKAAPGTRSVMQRTTIGTRPDGSLVQVYTTSEGTTRRGQFGRAQEALGAGSQRLGGARYTSTKRVRLMPESILEIANGDQATAKVLLRDAGYINYPTTGFGPGNAWVEGQQRMRAADRALADRVYRQHGITLG